jgi:hypothetical protein
MGNLRSTFACGPYDRTQALRRPHQGAGARYHWAGLVSLRDRAEPPSIEALLQHTHKQGLTERRVKIDELFAPSYLRDVPLSEGQQV